MPSLGREVERLVVRFLGFFNNAFEADKAAHFVTLVIEREKGEQAGHAAIPIGEGMDAEEVQNVERNEKQGIPSPVAPGIGKVLVKSAHGVFGEVRGEGFKADALGAIRQGFADFVGRNFPMSAIVPRIFEEIAVELEDDAICERDVGVILMDGIKHVAVAGDLAFGAVGGFCPRSDEFAESFVICRNDAFEAVGGFGALNLGDLAKVFEYLRRLLLVKLLSSLMFAQAP